MAICKNKIRFTFALLLTLFINSITHAQNVYYLGVNCGAIVNFHVIDRQPCSSITLFNVYDSVYYTQNIIACCIDSTVMIHAVNNYFDSEWLKRVNYILVGDSIQLIENKAYQGSIIVGFDMDYVELMAIIEPGTQIIDKKDGHPRPAAFECDCKDIDCDGIDENTKAICRYYKNMITEKLNQCRNCKRND